MVTSHISWKSSHIDTPKSSGVFVSLGNTEFKVFILVWSLKLEGGSSDFREGTGLGRKVQRLAHKGMEFVFESSLEMHSKDRGDCLAEALCGNDVTSYSRGSDLKTESGYSPFHLEEGKASTPWAARKWVPILVPF